MVESVRFSLKDSLTTEVFVLQEQMSTLQVKLDEEEHKNLKLQQRIDKLEHHSTQMQEVRPRARPRKGGSESHGKSSQDRLELFSLLCYFAYCSDKETCACTHTHIQLWPSLSVVHMDPFLFVQKKVG